MAPGNKYVLHFRNTLPYQALSTQMNVYKDPNVSNVHTHGLHISGESPSDDVTRWFEGQRGGDYVYDIPANHMGGTYWYHAHHHGSSFLQVSGGSFGQIIIDDSNDNIPANVAAMTKRQLVLGYIDPGAKGTGGDTLMSCTPAPGSTSCSARWTANGLANGSFCAPAGEWQHWRVLIADGRPRHQREGLRRDRAEPHAERRSRAGLGALGQHPAPVPPSHISRSGAEQLQGRLRARRVL
jgi:FtsP/CotA-like multicopper oxidase with cupredoxin domain